jgi:2-octaprenyl-6-methoxyphenol hydroxylase
VQNTDFDVIISGGGLSGLLTAIGLLNESPSLRLAIIDPTDLSQQSYNDNFDDRCLALSYGSLQLLNHWQVWSTLKPKAYPIHSIVTSDRGHIGKTIMRAQDFNLNAMGYVSGMRNIGNAFYEMLQAKLRDDANLSVQWLLGNSITQIDRLSDSINLTLSNEQTVSAKLLVVAEGAFSPTRELLGIESEQQQYEQAAIIANVKVVENNSTHKMVNSDASKSIAFERFTEFGPIAFLPISQNQYSVVWSVKPEEQERILDLSDEEFNKELQKAFGLAAGKVVSSSQRASYPLMLKRAKTLVSDRVALVGNAAHTIHPIAGQGFNLGLRDIAVLVHEIKQAAASNTDIGGFDVLANYESLREKDIERVTQFTDGLVRIFALPGRLPALARTTGLMLLQKFDGLQQWLALHFMSSKNYSASYKEVK